LFLSREVLALPEDAVEAPAAQVDAEASRAGELERLSEDEAEALLKETLVRMLGPNA